METLGKSLHPASKSVLDDKDAVAVGRREVAALSDGRSSPQPSHQTHKSRGSARRIAQVYTSRVSPEGVWYERGMQAEMSPEALEATATKFGIPPDELRALMRPALRLQTVHRPHVVGGSRLGGTPDLPVGLPWPRWDTQVYDAKERADAEAMADRSDYGRRRFEALETRGSRAPLPMTFLAQLELGALASSALPLPAAGHLWFFYELSEGTWGYCPTHRGSFRVLYAPEGTELASREPPADLATEHILSGAPVDLASVATFPSWPALPDDWADGYDDLIDALTGEAPEHQVGGHPDQIQGDMQRNCALVTQGVYLGAPPELPRETLDRMARDAPEWKLLLQLSSDDDLGWMWGDLGNLYFWMREDDIRRGNWDQAWFQLQCG